MKELWEICCGDRATPGEPNLTPGKGLKASGCFRGLRSLDLGEKLNVRISFPIVPSPAGDPQRLEVERSTGLCSPPWRKLSLNQRADAYLRQHTHRPTHPRTPESVPAALSLQTNILSGGACANKNKQFHDGVRGKRDWQAGEQQRKDSWDFPPLLSLLLPRGLSAIFCHCEQLVPRHAAVNTFRYPQVLLGA